DIAKASSRAEVLTQARSLMAAQRAQEVSGRLQTWVAAHPKDALAWQLLAVAYGNQNQKVRAIRADAESRAAQLDYAAALDRLKAAQALMRSNPSSADYMEGSIIDTRTRQIGLLLKEQALQDKVDR
ncbi:MAG: M48 family metalloprotease, partial [Polaromonas sp.]